MKPEEAEILRIISRYGHCEIAWEGIHGIWPEPVVNDFVIAFERFAGLPDRPSSMDQFKKSCENNGLEYYRRHDNLDRFVVRKAHGKLQRTP